MAVPSPSRKGSPCPGSKRSAVQRRQRKSIPGMIALQTGQKRWHRSIHPSGAMFVALARPALKAARLASALSGWSSTHCWKRPVMA
eukprot:13343948-Alexandrium_andersonii.AAC.1